MRIGFYGNPNNYPFMLARALQRQGHEILFIVVSPDRLNRPEHRYPDIRVPYPPWIRDFASSFRWEFLLPTGRRREITRLLNSCDLCILSEEGPALAGGLRVPYVAMLTGSNLEIFADPEKAISLKAQLFPGQPWLNHWIQAIALPWLIQLGLTRPQRNGISRARLVTYFARGLVPNGDRLLNSIGVPDERRVFVLMTDLELVRPCPPPANTPLRVFCVARLTWKRETYGDLMELDYKGTDVLLHGFARLKQRGRVPLPELHLVRKGRHLPETIALADQLGISEHITWLDELSQTEVLAEYARADIVVDQLAQSVVAMGGLDAMACGRPLIANMRPEVLSPADRAACPICQAATPEEVCTQLERLVSSSAERQRIGAASRRYVEQHYSSDAAARQLLARLGPKP